MESLELKATTTEKAEWMSSAARQRPQRKESMN